MGNNMAIFTKKIQSKFFEQILSGKKKYELRLNDFDIEEGDVLILEEWAGDPRKFTGRKIEKTVNFVGRFKIGELFWSENEIKDKGLQIISF